MRRPPNKRGSQDLGRVARIAMSSPVADNHSSIAAQIANGNLTRERSCDGKTRFKSYGFATMAAGKISIEAKKQFRVYACPFCGGFHMASGEGIAS